MRAKRVFVGDFRPPLLGELRVLWRSIGGERLYVLYRAVGGRKTGLAQRRVVLRHLLAPNPTIAVTHSQLPESNQSVLRACWEGLLVLGFDTRLVIAGQRIG